MVTNIFIAQANVGNCSSDLLQFYCAIILNVAIIQCIAIDLSGENYFYAQKRVEKRRILHRACINSN